MVSFSPFFFTVLLWQSNKQKSIFYYYYFIPARQLLQGRAKYTEGSAHSVFTNALFQFPQQHNILLISTDETIKYSNIIDARNSPRSLAWLMAFRKEVLNSTCVSIIFSSIFTTEKLTASSKFWIRYKKSFMEYLTRYFLLFCLNRNITYCLLASKQFNNCYHMRTLQSLKIFLTLYLPETKIAEFANSVGLDEVAPNEPPHQDLHCLPSSLWIFNMIQLDLNFFENLQTKILSSAFR